MPHARRPSIARHRPTLVLMCVLTAALCLTTAVPATASAASPRTYYVSCTGDDRSSGRSSATAWRTLARASAAALAAGDRLRLQRGCSFPGPLRTGTSAAPWAGTASAPVTIDAYGTGARPKVRDAAEDFVVTGRYLVFANLWTSSPPTSYDDQCQDAPRGLIYGWRLRPGSHHVTIKHSKAVGLHFAVWIEDGSHHDRIIGNDFVDNDVKDPNPASDAGAVAIAVHGNDNEVAWNHISGSDSCSRLYGRDGAAIDIYGGQRNRIHHNVAVDNNAFLEVGRNQQTGRLGRDTTVAYNDVRASLPTATFLVVRGAGSRYGPTPGTVVRHNSVYLSGAQSYAVQCTDGCTAGILDFRDNIVWAQDRVGFIDGSWSEARNIWWSRTRPTLWFTIAASSFHADPRFVDGPHGDLRLRSVSHAVNAGGTPPALPGGPRDLDRRAVPQGRRPDIGAYERPQ